MTDEEDDEEMDEESQYMEMVSGGRIGKRSGGAEIDTRVCKDVRTLLALARTCRAISAIAHAVLYRAVKIEGGAAFGSLRRAELFARTVTTSSTVTVKRATRLVLGHTFEDEPFYHMSVAERRKRRDETARWVTAVGTTLGLVVKDKEPRPRDAAVLGALRTLVVTSSLLAPFVGTQLPSTCADVLRGSYTSPAEIVIDTHFTPDVLKRAIQPSLSSLAQLTARTTHLAILQPPQMWSLPSETLGALGFDCHPGISSSGWRRLTHLSLIRRANANEDNDREFVEDIARIVRSSSPAREGDGGLECVVVCVLPDTMILRSIAYELDAETANDDLDEFKKGQLLESHLAQTYIWRLLAGLTGELPGADLRGNCNRNVKRGIRLCVVPGWSGAWTRVVAVAGDGQRILGPAGAWWDDSDTAGASGGLGFWRWALEYEEGRRVRESEQEEAGLNRED